MKKQRIILFLISFLYAIFTVSISSAKEEDKLKLIVNQSVNDFHNLVLLDKNKVASLYFDTEIWDINTQKLLKRIPGESSFITNPLSSSHMGDKEEALKHCKTVYNLQAGGRINCQDELQYFRYYTNAPGIEIPPVGKYLSKNINNITISNSNSKEYNLSKSFSIPKIEINREIVNFGLKDKNHTNSAYIEKINFFDTNTKKVVKTFKNYNSPIISLSKTENLVFTGTKSGIIYVWDYKNSKIINTLKAFSKKKIDFLLANSNRLAYANSKGEIEIRNLGNNQVIKNYKFKGNIDNLYLSDNKLIGEITLNYQEKLLIIIDLQSGNKIDEFTDYLHSFTMFENKFYYLSTDGALKIRDLHSGKLENSIFENNKTKMLSINYEAYGNKLISSYSYLDEYGNLKKDDKNLSGFINILDFSNGYQSSPITKSEGLITIKVTDKDNKYFGYKVGNTFNIINISTSQKVFSFNLPSSIIENSLLHIIGNKLYLVTISTSNMFLDIFDMKTGKLIKNIKIINNLSFNYKRIDIIFSNDKLINNDFIDKKIRIWDINSGKLLKVINNQQVVSPQHPTNDDILFTTNIFSSEKKQNYLNIWNINNLKLSNTYKDFDAGDFITIYYADNDRMIYQGDSDTIKIFNLKTNKTEKLIKLDYMNYSRNYSGKNYFINNTNNSFQIYDIKTGKLKANFKVEDEWIIDFFVSNTKFVTETVEGKIQIRNILNGKLEKEFKESRVISLVEGTIDKLIIQRDDSRLEIWDLNKIKLIATYYSFPTATFIITPEGYFTGFGNYQDYLHFVKEDKIINIDDFKTFQRPDLVKKSIIGENMKSFPKLNYGF